MDILRTSTSKSRLRKFRERAASSKAESMKDWRNCRYGYHLSEKSYSPTLKDGKYLSESLGWIGENLGDSGKLLSLGYTGWYVDSHVGDVMRGAVIKIRCPRGVIYMPATYCTGWDGSTLYADDAVLVPKGSCEDDHLSAIEDVARYADQNAKCEAEECKEADAKYQAEESIASLKDDIKTLRSEMRVLVSTIRQQRLLGEILGPICTRLIDDIKSMRKAVSRKFARIAALEKDYWLAVS